MLYFAQCLLFALGLAFTAYWAYQAFDAPPIKFGDAPALPRYMTQPTQYRLGMIVFVAACLLIYILIAYFHEELLPIIGAINPDLKSAMEKSAKDGTLSYPLIVIFSAAIFVGLLKVDKEWNPIFLLRRVIHGWVSIPQIANALMVMMRDQLIVPVGARAGVAADPDSPYVAVGDFDKDRRSLDRQWAELCYIRQWLERNRAQGTHFTFFNEPSFAWTQLQSNFDAVRKLVVPLKQEQKPDDNIMAVVAGQVTQLHAQYCRLAACFLVFKNETQKDAFHDANAFGVTIAEDPPRANPLRYTFIFAVTIILAIYLGVVASALGWDLLHHSPLDLNQDIATKWMLYALANYGMPIFAALLLRYLGWRTDKSQPSSYLASYAAIFLVALCVAIACLSTAQIFLAAPDSRSLFEKMYDNVKWCFSPAVVCIYVIYHLDRQIDPLLPNVGASAQGGFPERLVGCLAFACIVAAFSALPTIGIPSSNSLWSLGKLQAVILGTTFMVGLIMALACEFLLAPPAPATVAAAPEQAAAIARQDHRSWVITGALASVLLAGLAVLTYELTRSSVVPRWAPLDKTVYLGKRVPLKWSYEALAHAASAHFVLESTADGAFEEVACVDTNHHSVNRINGTREWRVRAVADCATMAPLSQWSDSIRVTQYDSVYERIKSRGQANIVFSSSQDQDVFKWGDRGFDIALARLIVHDLSSRMGRAIALTSRSVPWDQLLPAAESGAADFAISSITRTAERESKYNIQFTDSYYCTSYSLIYRSGTHEGRLLDMVRGKTVGAQRETTGADLVNKLAPDGSFTVSIFDTTENLQDALLDMQIDFAVTDTSFAQSARLDSGNRLAFKEFGRDDTPSALGEPTQEYAIAVRKDEPELLGAINETLAEAKRHGTLANLFKTTAEQYEDFKHFQRGSRSFRPDAWECPGRTVAGQ